MRVEEIHKPIAEESTPTFLVKFRDETGADCIPTILVWDLTTFDGTVLAIKQSVAVPAATSVITLTSAQTRFVQDETKKAERLLTVHATYNSAYGNNLIARKQVKFTIEQFLMVGYPLDIDIYEVIFMDDYIQSVGVS
jgi:hypothetical protein